MADRSDAIVNKQGGVGHEIQNPSQKLLAMVGSYMGEPGFFAEVAAPKDNPKKYNASVLDTRGRELFEAACEVALSDSSEDLLIIAHWARQELNMRLAPQILLVAAARYLRVDNVASPLVRYMPKISSRPDDLLQVHALYNALFGKLWNNRYPRATFPSCLKRAMARTLSGYDVYQLLKYGSNKRRPNWGDVLGALRGGRLLPKSKRQKDGHYPLSKPMRDYLVDGKVSVDSPAPVKARSDFFKLAKDHPLDEEVRVLMKVGKLTWENFVSHFGRSKDPARHRQVWDFAFKLMPSMARLRNLRNGMEAGISDIVKIAEELASPETVARGRQLPFRYYTAQRVVKAAKAPAKVKAKIAKAMDTALENSIVNLPELKGRTAVFVDVSGSMTWSKISKDSTLTPADVAALLGALLSRKAPDSVVLAFATSVKPVDGLSKLSVPAGCDHIRKVGQGCGGGTNIALCLDHLRSSKQKVDRVIMLTDCQTGLGGSVGDALRRYRKFTKSKVFYHSVDLQAHGQSAVPATDSHTQLLSGFTPRLLDLISSFEGRVEAPEARPKSAELPTLDELRGRFQVAIEA